MAFDEALVADSLRVYYDAEASQRDRGAIQGWKRVERQRFVDAVHAQDRSTGTGAEATPCMLELGSGPGRDAQYFSEECGFNVVACLDLSAEMAAKCRQRGLRATACDFTVTGAIGRVAAECSLDAVYAMNSLLHVPKHRVPVLLSEIAKAMRPGGVLFVGLYGGEDFEGPWHGDPSGHRRFFAYYTDEALREVLCPPSAQPLFTIHSFDCVDPGTSRGGSAQYHFQSVVLQRTASSLAGVAHQRGVQLEASWQQRTEVMPQSVWDWQYVTNWSSLLTCGLIGHRAWFNADDRVVITCRAAGDRYGQVATIVRRIFAAPMSYLDTYLIALPDGSTMVITRNNLALHET